MTIKEWLRMINDYFRAPANKINKMSRTTGHRPVAWLFNWCNIMWFL